MIKKPTTSPITFCSWYQCDRLDEISSGMEDLVKYGETISKGEEFNICKALGYELLGSKVTEGEAYAAGKRRYEEILKQKEEEEKRRAEQERVRLLNMQCANAKKEKYIKQTGSRAFAWIIACFPYLLVLGIVAVLKIRSLICDNIGELYSLICNNIFLIALFLVPTIIIYVGYKIETKK